MAGPLVGFSFHQQVLCLREVVRCSHRPTHSRGSLRSATEFLPSHKGGYLCNNDLKNPFSKFQMGKKGHGDFMGGPMARRGRMGLCSPQAGLRGCAPFTTHALACARTRPLLHPH